MKKVRNQVTDEKMTGESKVIESNKKFFGSVFLHKSEGIDGILVTVGLCIIALLLCVVMKDKMAALLETVISGMSNKASAILNGV